MNEKNTRDQGAITIRGSLPVPVMSTRGVDHARLEAVTAGGFFGVCGAYELANSRRDTETETGTIRVRSNQLPASRVGTQKRRWGSLSLPSRRLGMRASIKAMLVFASTPRLLLAMLVVGCLFFQQSSNAQVGKPYRISGDMVTFGDVSYSINSNDGKYVVYVADQDNDEVFEIFSVPTAGGPAVKLNPSLVSGGDVLGFRITPDSQHVIYLADQTINGLNTIQRVPIGGGDSQQLSPFSDNISFQISPDSTQIVYLARFGLDQEFNLYSVPVSGNTASVKLNGTLTAGGNVSINFAISNNSASVIYTADQDVDNVREIYRVPITGGTVTQLNQVLTAGADVADFKMSTDSSRVVYRVSKSGLAELFSVPLTGGSAIKLNGPLEPNARVNRFLLSDDNSRVIYFADQETLFVQELFSVPIAGGTPIKLNTTLPTGGEVNFALISPNGQQVVYQADQDTLNISELYSVSITGGAPVKLNPPLVAGGSVRLVFGGIDDPLSWAISPNGSNVVYVARQDVSTDQELYNVPINGGTSTQLNAPLVADGDVSSFKISGDGTRVAYLADQDTDSVRELYAVPINGGTPTKLNKPLPFSSLIRRYSISNDGHFITYQADQNVFDEIELFAYRFEEESLCLPIKTSNGNFAVICL